ncbi:MAG: hypothetical protein Q7U21_04950, partial [Lutibacter sp.]|nr:hypothetical protein [Lutibacter sp.]
KQNFHIYTGSRLKKGNGREYENTQKIWVISPKTKNPKITPKILAVINYYLLPRKYWRFKIGIHGKRHRLSCLSVSAERKKDSFNR